jgi:nitrous oxide reductase accessory protein NosL
MNGYFRRSLWAAGWVLALALAGCEVELPPGPPAVQLGHDLCVHCGMIISDQRFAAATVVLRDGKRTALLFDDIGDLIDYHRETPTEVAVERYVTDYNTKAWVAFDQASFVVAADAHTPMGSGLHAVSTPAAANALAEQLRGKVVPASLVAAVRSGQEQHGACCTGRNGG